MVLVVVVAATRQGDSDTREAPRGGEGDDSLLRVARAGADSPLRDAPRHYRVRRHFLRGPFLLSPKLKGQLCFTRHNVHIHF